MDFFARLESLRERWNVLEHPFYQRWSDGSLEREELAFYAGEYRARRDRAGRGRRRRVARLRARGARAARRARRGGGRARGSCGTASRTRWTPTSRAPRARDAWPAASRGPPVATPWRTSSPAFTIESGQPAIARTKLDGLLDRYGFEEGPATEYFSLHAELDHEHAAQSRELIEERLADADLDRLLEVAEGVLRGNWELLDGCDRAADRRLGRSAERGSRLRNF